VCSSDLIEASEQPIRRTDFLHFLRGPTAMSKKTWHQPELLSLEARSLTSQLADSPFADDGASNDDVPDALGGNPTQALDSAS